MWPAPVRRYGTGARIFADASGGDGPRSAYGPNESLRSFGQTAPQTYGRFGRWLSVREGTQAMLHLAVSDGKIDFKNTKFEIKDEEGKGLFA